MTTLASWFSPQEIPVPDEALALVVDGPVAHVVLNRPAQRNAMTEAMWAAMTPLIECLDANEEIRLVMLRGMGEKAFSGGADISEFTRVFADPASAASYNNHVRAAQQAIERLCKPSIALIRGACVGGGCGLAMACDLRFAADTARLGIAPARIGSAYSVPDTRRLVALVGPARSKDILFSARLLDAYEARAIGLVDRVASAENLEATVADYAQTLLTNSSQSITHAKQTVDLLARLSEGSLDAQARAFDDSFASDHFQEGFTAFCEKRPPLFR